MHKGVGTQAKFGTTKLSPNTTLNKIGFKEEEQIRYRDKAMNYNLDLPMFLWVEASIMLFAL